MSKLNLPNQKDEYDKLNKRLAKYLSLVQKMFDELNVEACEIALSSGYDINDDKPFTFKRFPKTKKRVKDLQKKYSSNLTGLVYSGITDEWRRSNIAQDNIADSVLKSITSIVSGERYTKYYETNQEALKAFKERKEKGLSISQKIWNQAVEYKDGVEASLALTLQNGIEKGMSAVTLSKRVSKYLNDYDKIREDYKDKFGKAKEIHDCQYQAMRLARSEINMAYRTAEQARWQQMDFIVGYEIKLSKVHHHRMPKGDVCDDLSGKYPKDFKWTGWHPNDMCYVVPILKTDEELWNLDDNIKSKNEVTDVPNNFKEWVIDNKDRIDRSAVRGTTPYFLRENAHLVKGVTLENSIKDVMSIAKKDGNALQSIAESISNSVGGKVTPINYKSFDSIKRKVETENISPFSLKDTARTTIIVDNDNIDYVLKELGKETCFSRLKRQKAENFYGYSGNIVNMKFGNGQIYEIQVNTPEMIFAKEPEPISKMILGDELWNEIKNKYKVEGGLGHKYYEEIRVLNKVKDRKIMNELVKKSFNYYSLFK